MTNLPKIQDQPSTSLTTPFSEPWLRLLRTALGWENGKPILMTRIRPTSYQARQIRVLISSLADILSPSSDNRQRSAIELAKLFAAFPAQAQSDSPAELRIEAYFEALDGVPAWVIGEARARILRGEVSLSHRFTPTPPELRTVCNLVMRPMRADLADLERIQAAAEYRQPDVGESKRVSEGFEKLRSELVSRLSPSVS